MRPQFAAGPLNTTARRMVTTCRRSSKGCAIRPDRIHATEPERKNQYETIFFDLNLGESSTMTHRQMKKIKIRAGLVLSERECDDLNILGSDELELTEPQAKALVHSLLDQLIPNNEVKHKQP